MTTFQKIERRLVDWFDASEFNTELRDGEWIVHIEGEELSVTGMAMAITRDLLDDAAFDYMKYKDAPK